jgi:HAD superfamily hydrolase (TIGR01509 family)
VDGTLVDSNDAHAHAWVAALAEQGVEVPFAKVRRCIGMGGDKLLPAVCGDAADSARGKKISERRKEIFLKTYLPTLRPTPGAPDLLHHLRSRGLRLAVASSAKKDELEGLLRVCGADELIESSTSADDADRSKPDPDVVHAALGQLKLGPGEVVLLGDTPYDIEAAGRAGVGVIAFRCGGWADADLAGALSIYDHPADLLVHYDSSPLGR